MKFSISNIAWAAEDDEKIYGMMKEYSFTGLEIAPTRIFPEAPYDKFPEASLWREEVKRKYGFDIPSMQSIWYGRKELLFGSADDRKTLLDYTKKAIDFAETVHCGNLVFGCPKNRNIPEGGDSKEGIAFFRELGEYAASKGTCIGIEANPTIYGTNYIIGTAEAIDLVNEVGSKGIGLNVDVGTMIHNNEGADVLKGKVSLINHVHISEPGLKPIEKRSLHKEILEVLAGEGYDRYVSIEMGRTEDTAIIREKLEYLRRIG